MANFFVIFFVLIYTCNTDAISNYSFPDNFTFGAATSAYQIEGAWTDEGKGENIWDHAIHANPSIIEDGTNADDADNTFYDHDEDVAALVKMGLTHYKFSLSWSRLVPEGRYINDTEGWVAIEYYQYFIEDLLKNNITPIVTLHHWDLPQPIQEWGGWTNESNIVHFVDYARLAFTYCFEARYFITFDDPKEICKSGYGDGTLAPFLSNSGVDDYNCARIVLKAHAAVYKMFQEEFAKMIEGRLLSIALDSSWSEPKSNNQEDKDAAERRNQFEFGLYAHPIFIGNWPQEVIDRVNLRSTGENRTTSRLPVLTEAEIAEIKGTADFMAVDFFDTRLVANDVEAAFDKPGYDKDMRVKLSTNQAWSEDADGDVIVPGSIRKFLKYLKKNYGDPEILITGNGYADDSGTTHDGDRVTFLSEHLSNVVDAIHEDKVKVFGYTYWSLLDSFEWTKGKKPHFGLYGVDLDFWSNGTRLPKRSSYYYALAVKERKVPDPSELITTVSPPTEPTTKKPTTTIETTIPTEPIETTIPTEPIETTTSSNPTSQLPETTTSGTGQMNIVESLILTIAAVAILLVHDRLT